MNSLVCECLVLFHTFLNLGIVIRSWASDRGAIIEDIVRIERNEESHFIFEDADFSLVTIKQLIRQGQEDAERILNEKGGR